MRVTASPCLCPTEQVFRAGSQIEA